MVKARIGQLQAERIFPSQSITYCVSSLAVCQAFHKLEHRNQRQAPWGESWLTMGRKQVSKRLIGVDSSQRITYLHENIATGKDRVSHTSHFFWNWWDRQRFEGHG